MTSFASPRDAREHGIVTIFQELTTVPWLSVAENVVLGSEPTVGPGHQLYSRRQTFARARDMLSQLGAAGDIDPKLPAYRLSTAQKQIVEIARALLHRAPVIIMDEPTAALSENEAQALLQIVRQLRAEGRSVLFVSHRLDEVLSVADRVTVLRGGRHIATLPADEIAGTNGGREGNVRLSEMLLGHGPIRGLRIAQSKDRRSCRPHQGPRSSGRRCRLKRGGRIGCCAAVSAGILLFCRFIII